MSSLVDFTLPRLTRDELDNLVLRTGNTIAKIGYTSTTAGQVDDQHDWSFKWVNRKGMGNHGSLVAIPKSGRARKIWRKAILNRVANLTTPEFAKAYTTASKGVQYSLEERVITFVYEHGHMLISSDLPVSWGQAENKFGKETINKAREQGLSFWRLLAATKVATKLYL